MSEEIEFTIHTDGTIEIDMIGYKGKACEADMKRILKELGAAEKTKKKSEYYKSDKVKLKGKE